jgi:nicotinamide riboside transporter PnuC
MIDNIKLCCTFDAVINQLNIKNMKSTKLNRFFYCIAFIIVMLSFAVLMFAIATAGYLFSSDVTLAVCCVSILCIVVSFGIVLLTT